MVSDRVPNQRVLCNGGDGTIERPWRQRVNGSCENSDLFPAAGAVGAGSGTLSCGFGERVSRWLRPAAGFGKRGERPCTIEGRSFVRTVGAVVEPAGWGADGVAGP